jgi:hypothetical protein
MNKITRCLALTGGLMIWPLAADEWREFSSALGRTLVAKVLRVENEVVTLERRDGKQFALEFKDLSAADVVWLEKWEAGKPMAAEDKDGAPGAVNFPVDQELKKNLFPRSQEEIAQALKQILGRAIPDGIEEKAGKAVNRLNAYRYLCGVSFDVEADARMNKQATEAAKACDGHGSISHDIGHFTELCNLSAGSDVVGSVAGYLNDSGASNREARAHRRWCLNPPMGRAGFGGGTKFVAMACMDASGKDSAGDTWSYPGKGFFPLEYLHGDAWSLYLREGSPSRNALEVEVFRLAARPQKPFTWADKDPGEKLEIGWISSKMNTINFEPKGANKEGIYWVRIRGAGVREQYLVELY